jgi:hypothetical protein
MKEGEFTKGLDSDINRGLKGLRISLSVLVLLILFLVIFLIASQNDLSNIYKVLFRKPEYTDYLAFFAGSLLFIAIPFLLGIKVGTGLKK